MTVQHRLDLADPALREFWIPRALQTLTTLTAAGRPHTVPVAATLDATRPLLRILTSGTSRKVANIRAADPAWVTVCQVDGAHWTTLEGRARIEEDPAAIAEAETLYAARFRTPRPNPQRVVLLVDVERALGRLP